MSSHAQALLRVARGDDTPTRPRLVLSMVTVVILDFLILGALVDGVEARRVGESYGQHVFVFALSILIWRLTANRGRQMAVERFTSASRARVVCIAERLPQLPRLTFESIGPGVVLTRLLGDGNRLATAGVPLAEMSTGTVRLLLGTLFAFTVSVEAAAVAVAMMLLLAAVMVGQMYVLDAGASSSDDDEARLLDLLTGHVRGGVPLKLHRPRMRAFGAESRRLVERLREVRTTVYSSWFERQFAADALIYGLLGLNAFVLPHFIDITPDLIREMNVIALWLALGAAQIASSLPALVNAAGALGRLDALVARVDGSGAEPRPADDELDGGPFAGFSTIALKGATFDYPPRPAGSTFGIGPLDVTLRRGELVLVTGANGSGKSTFARVLTGLYPLADGTRTVDGTAVGGESLAAYRQIFGTIFVDHCIFERAYGLGPDAEARAPALLRTLGLEGKTALVDGRIAQRALSTGQSKRLAMVLARLRDKPVLVLDEWAADQAPANRSFFYRELLPTLRDEGRLVVVISHDDQFFGHADRVLRFEDGRLREVTP